MKIGKPAASELQLAAIADQASRRRCDGHRLFVVALLPIQLGAWGDICEAIEGEDWTLVHFAIAPEGHAVAVFRTSPITP